MEYYITDKSNINLDSNSLKITGVEFKHLSRVLRKKIGDKLEVTDGNLNVFQCKITSINKENIECEIVSKEYNINEPETELTVYYALLKNMGRYEFGIEKLIELGVKRIIPLITERTILKETLSKNKISRLNHIILSAVSQSQRCFLPVIDRTVILKDIIAEDSSDNLFMYELAPEESKQISISHKKVNIIIGPEGGFTEHEADFLSKSNWKPCSLGKRKYRAETAAIIAASNILNHN